MTLAEAIEIVASRPAHGRYRDLCDPSHPAYNPDYIPVVMRLASEGPAATPSLARQAANLAGAVGRVAAAAAKGEAVTVPPAIQEARLAVCLACEFNTARETGGVRCAKCGCGRLKLSLSTERCPIGKWERWEGSRHDRDSD